MAQSCEHVFVLLNGSAMSVAYYIVLNQDIPGLDAEVDGAAMARHHPALEAVADALGLPSLDRFISIADDELDELLGADGMADIGDDDADDGIEWCSAQEGLAFFTALAQHIEQQPQALAARQPGADAAAVLADLADYCRVLQVAAAHDADFYLAIDF